MKSYVEMAEKAIKDEKARQITRDIHTWENAGEKVIGKVIDIQPFEGGKFDKPCNQYTIETDDGLITTLLGGATDKQLMIHDLLEKVVIIEFLGKIELEDQRKCNRFKVLIV